VTLGVPLTPGASGSCEVTFTSAIVRVPARVQHGSKDDRRLATHFYTFDYSGHA
jgi:hypothetical protein